MPYDDESFREKVYYRIVYVCLLVMTAGFVVFLLSYSDSLYLVTGGIRPVYDGQPDPRRAQIMNLGLSLIAGGAIVWIAASRPVEKLKALANYFLPGTRVVKFLLTDDNSGKLDEMIRDGWIVESMDPPDEGMKGVRHIVILRKYH